MKIIIISILLIASLFAKSKDSCYTVQLLSNSYSQKSFDALNLREFPSSCRVMHISKKLTVRCGCFEELKKAKNFLPEFKTIYSKAYIATTYKYRFKKKKEVFVLDDEELKSYFKLFFSQQEFEYAQEIATIGYEYNSDSLYWNQKLLGLSLNLNATLESRKYIDFLYLTQYKKSYIALKKSTKEDRIIALEENLNLEYLTQEDRDTYLAMFWRLASLYEDKEYASNFFDMPQKNKKYNYKDAKLLAYSYFKNYDIKMGYKALKLCDKQGADENFYKVLNDFTWYMQNMRRE